MKRARRLIAEEGHRLTQVKDVDILDRVFAKRIVLAPTANPEDYKNIPMEEVVILQKQQEEALKKQMEEWQNEATIFEE